MTTDFLPGITGCFISSGVGLILSGSTGLSRSADSTFVSISLWDNYQAYVDAYNRLQGNFMEDLLDMDDNLEDSEIKIF